MRVGVRRVDAIGEHRLEKRGAFAFFRAERVAGTRRGKTRNGADRSRFCGVGQLVFFAGVQPDLVDLFLNGSIVRRDTQNGAGVKRAARHAQPCEPRPLRVAADLIDSRAELLGGGLCRGVERERVQQLFHAVEPQRRAEKTGKEPFLADELPDLLRRDRAGGEKALQRLLALRRRLLIPAVVGEIRAVRREERAHLLHPCRAAHAGKVDFVDKEKRRHMAAPQQPPERTRVTLHAVRAADDQYRRVQHGERPLRFAGEVHVTGRIEQRHGAVFPREPRLLGKDRDAALPLLRIGVEKGVGVINSAEPPQLAGGIEHRFGERRFSRVHVGEYAETQRSFFGVFLVRHTASSFLFLYFSAALYHI